MIAIDLSKQQALDADPNEIQEINFKVIVTVNQRLNTHDNATMFFVFYY